MIAQARDRAEEEAEEDEEDADQTRQASPRRALQRDDDRTQLERDGSLEVMLLLASSFPSPQVSSLSASLQASFIRSGALPLPLSGVRGKSRRGSCRSFLSILFVTVIPVYVSESR